MGRPNLCHAGDRFGKWTLIEKFDKRRWLCKCDCGTERVVRTDSLKIGNSLSCGCDTKRLQSEAKKHPRDDITGKRFGSWTILGYAGNGRWKCLCDCGTERTLQGGQLRNGTSHSCGCKKAERCAAADYKHGMSKSKIYGVWRGMKGRCTREKDRAYKWYGARGIKVCDDWLKSFEKFYEWAIKNGYEEGLSIDRIDVNGDYGPENCRWATQKEQANNKRNSTFYEVAGENLTVAQAADKYNVSASGLRKRMKKGVELRDAIENILSQKETGRYGPGRDHGRA